jgi:hypothetical protein
VPPGAPPQAGEQQDDEEQPLWAIARLEVKVRPAQSIAGLIPVDQPWGKTLLPQSLGNLGTIKQYSRASVAKRFNDQKKSLLTEGKTPAKLRALAEWALEHGMINAFLQTMDELKKEDPNHAAVKALDAVNADMKRRPSADDPSAVTLIEELKATKYRPLLSENGHYVLYTDLQRLDRTKEPEIRKWLERLETTYHSFFYWFALQGQALPVPPHRLVAVLVDSPADFEAKHQSFNPGPMVADGFTVRRDNVAVFSARRLGEAYDKLEKHNLKEWGMLKVGRDELLRGVFSTPRRDLAQPQIVAKLQTLALLQKAMEEEAERSAASHEGTRQLLAATGLLPRSVVAAEWIHFGMASFFETPYEAYYTGTALPSWLYVVEFKHYRKHKALANSQEVLLKTITDQFFIQANSTQEYIDDNKDERENEEPVLQEELRKARTTAWALTYYLARHKLGNLQRYFQELASLPRDLEFDAPVLQGCFARAFGLVDPTDPTKLDMGKVKGLADAWYAKMEGVSLDLLDVQAEALKDHAPTRATGQPRQPRPQNQNPNLQPGGPNSPYPGGYPGSGPRQKGLGRPGVGG